MVCQCVGTGKGMKNKVGGELEISLQALFTYLCDLNVQSLLWSYCFQYFHCVDVHKHVISFLHFDGEESPSKEHLVANGFSFMHTTKSLPRTYHIVTILNVCKLGIHEMFTKQCKSLGLFFVVIDPCNFFTWQGGTPINKFSKGHV